MTTDRDHFLLAPSSWVAGASDIGKRHRVNQDAVALATTEDPRSAVVAVSDGVTTALASEVGSLLAARRSCEALRSWRPGGDISAHQAMSNAFAEAHYAVLSGAPEAACTLVVALVSDLGVVVGNVGDSRAYWFGDDGTAAHLSVDDSVAQLRIDLGADRISAEGGANAHAITRWLGRQATDVDPRVCSYAPDGSGLLVVCTDGLWNYASEASELARVIDGLRTDASSPARLASALVAWANEQGGKDNITVAVVECG